MASVTKNVAIVGGHGKIALRLARLLAESTAPKYSVKSIIRNETHAADISSISPAVRPLLLSLEDAPVADFARAFQGQDIVYFIAGAGGHGGEERTKKVDYEGAVKVFDAIEAVPQQKPRLILVSAIDVRDPNKIPAHYNEADLTVSTRVRTAIPAYMHWKYEADKNLVTRTAFKWTILRPGGLTDKPGTGKASVGRTHITETIPRDDVAQGLAVLAEREDAAGLAIDFVGGDRDIREGLDEAIKRGETDFLG